MNSNVMCVRFVNPNKWRADFYVGQVIDNEEDSFITIKKPIIITIGDQHLELSPPHPFMEHVDVTVPREDVLYMGKAIEEIAMKYNEGFGSGLVMVNRNLDQVLKQH